VKPGSMLVYAPRVPIKRGRNRQYSMTKRRRVDIVADILNVAASGAKKTWIMRDANLSYNILQRYLEDTLGIGFLQFNHGLYETTEKGRKFLEMYVQFWSKYSRLQKDLSASWLELESLERMCIPPIKNVFRCENSHEKRPELMVP
jgi:predicted transcriptional regulator